MAATTLALTRHYQYRKAKNLVMMTLTIFATVITLTPLFLVLGYLLYKGASSINFAFSRMVSGGETEVECRRLDELFADAAPTHVKMDIEGAEPDAIQGAAGLLHGSRPAMSICIYHRNEHLWEIPLLIKSLAPDYGVYIRRYAEDCWEMVCYAVPPERPGLA